MAHAKQCEPRLALVERGFLYSPATYGVVVVAVDEASFVGTMDGAAMKMVRVEVAVLPALSVAT